MIEYSEDYNSYILVIEKRKGEIYWIGDEYVTETESDHILLREGSISVQYRCGFQAHDGVGYQPLTPNLIT